MRVLIADDRIGIRSALRLLLEQEQGIDVVGEAEDADALTTLVRDVQPDVVLLDWELPSRSMVGLLPAILEKASEVSWVVLSGRVEARVEALAAGADAFVSKGDPPEVLLEVLRALASGRSGCC